MIARFLGSLLILILSGGLLQAQTFEQMKKGKWAVRSSIKSVKTDFKHKVLIVVGDGAEVLDTVGPYYRLGEVCLAITPSLFYGEDLWRLRLGTLSS